ncbi:MAG: site-specific integrase [Pyrinomonadaceae bacterium]|nr:site-specific integrase [Pyrinomonadaceae bacterium]
MDRGVQVTHFIKEAVPEARTKAEAEQVQTQIKRAIFDDKYNRAAGNKDFAEFVDEVFVPWAKASKRSWQDDEERARPLKAFFEGKRLRDITPMLIEKYKQQRLNTTTLHKRKRSPATVNRELQVLSKVFSMAYDNGLVETNPMRRVHRLREAPARERYLTDEEEKKLFAILVGRRAHIRPIVVVALHTGMRQGEILGLKWENVDFEQEAIFVAHTKTGRPRKLPMGEPVKVELRSLKQDALPHEHVFSYARTGLKLTTFRHAWEGACQAAKISSLRFHDLRHTFATRLRAKGVHEMDIMSLLGHTTLQMTARYTHAIPENLRTAVNSLTNGPAVSSETHPEPSLTVGLPPRSARSAPRSRQLATGTEGM